MLHKYINAHMSQPLLLQYHTFTCAGHNMYKHFSNCLSPGSTLN